MEIDIKLILAQAFNFFILLYVLQKFLFKPLLKSMQERQVKIEKGLAYTDEMEKRLTEIEKREQDILRQAEKKGEQAAEKILSEAKLSKDQVIAEARKESEGLILQAKQMAEDERKAMMKHVKEDATELIMQTAEKVLRKSIQNEKHSQLIDAMIRDLPDDKVGTK